MIIFGLRIEGITYKIATALAALVLVSAGTLIWYVVGAPPWDPTHREFSVTVTPDWALPPIMTLGCSWIRWKGYFPSHCSHSLCLLSALRSPSFLVGAPNGA